jgi:hypothetical protein
MTTKYEIGRYYSRCGKAFDDLETWVDHDMCCNGECEE